MICSLNEIEALSRKAARGAGMSWGLAEESGKAVRWLCDKGFPGPELLAELLRRNDGKSYSDLVPQQSDGIWRAPRGPLCPIITGSLICDRAADLKTETTMRLGEVAVPLLLVPFASEAARSESRTLVLDWRDVTFVLDGSAPQRFGEEAALRVPETASVTLHPTDEKARGSVRTDPERLVSPETSRILEHFATRTYAPATEASRAGAGAGPEGD